MSYGPSVGKSLSLHCSRAGLQVSPMCLLHVLSQDSENVSQVCVVQSFLDIRKLGWTEPYLVSPACIPSNRPSPEQSNQLYGVQRKFKWPERPTLVLSSSSSHSGTENFQLVRKNLCKPQSLHVTNRPSHLQDGC